MIGTGIDVGIKLVTAYRKYRQDKEKIEFLRTLVKISDYNLDDFIETTLNAFIRDILLEIDDLSDLSERKENKIRNEIVKFCKFIPKVL